MITILYSTKQQFKPMFTPSIKQHTLINPKTNHTIILQEIIHIGTPKMYDEIKSEIDQFVKNSPNNLVLIEGTMGDLTDYEKTLDEFGELKLVKKRETDYNPMLFGNIVNAITNKQEYLATDFEYFYPANAYRLNLKAQNNIQLLQDVPAKQIINIDMKNDDLLELLNSEKYKEINSKAVELVIESGYLPATADTNYFNRFINHVIREYLAAREIEKQLTEKYGKFDINEFSEEDKQAYLQYDVAKSRMKFKKGNKWILFFISKGYWIKKLNPMKLFKSNHISNLIFTILIDERNKHSLKQIDELLAKDNKGDFFIKYGLMHFYDGEYAFMKALKERGYVLKETKQIIM